VRSATEHRRVVRLAAAPLALALLGVGAVACSSGSNATSPSASGPTVTGAFGSTPVITLGKAKAPAKTVVRVVSRGTGRALKAGDLALVDDFGRTWKSATGFQNTYGATTPPDTLPVGGQLGLPGLDNALVGVPLGSRVLVVLPPSDGFANVTSLPTGVSKTDTAILVFDVRDGFAGNAGPSGTPVTSTDTTLPVVSGPTTGKPVITIPKTAPPTALKVATLIQGTGPATAKGDEIVVQYVGQVWSTGKEFDSSWSRSSPAGFTIGAGQLIPAWDQGLVGVKVGSRVLIVAPPASGYGAAGQSNAGISGTDTLVFVVDVLGAYAS
jgi:peptidylprolyl isomerase